MNHAGEIAPLTQLVRPHVAIVTTIEPVHLGIFRLGRGDRRRQGRNFRRPRAGRRRRAQPRQPALRPARRRRAKARRRAASSASASTREADARLLRCRAASGLVDGRSATSSASDVDLQARRAGPASGAEFACRAGGGRARRRRSRARGAGARRACRPEPAAARASRSSVPGGSALLIDESYNANPASMRAAIALLGQAPVGAARPAHRRARRHAGAGRARRDACIAASPSRWSRPAQSIWCSAAGPLMRALWEALPSARAGRLCRDRGGARSRRCSTPCSAGDAVMVKGSLGSKMGPIVKALERSSPAGARREAATLTV